MRHRMIGRKLSRSSSHRKALFRNLANALLQHELIKTTLPKAKELRRFVEPLITLGREDSLSKRRVAFSRLNNADVVKKLFSEIGPRFVSRPGGYVRILKCGYRRGDCAPMAYMELVESGSSKQKS